MGSFVRMVAAIGLLGGALVPQVALSATCTVTSASEYDPWADPPETPISGTLRYCVEAVGNTDGVATDIVFNLSGAGPWVINTVGVLNITEPDTTIDGTTQSGWTSVDPGSASSFGVIIDSTYNTEGTAIRVAGDDAVIKGLLVREHNKNGMGANPLYAIDVDADDVAIKRCRLQDNGAGIIVSASASGVELGSATAADGNVIHGAHQSFGILMNEVGSGNKILKNTVTNVKLDAAIAVVDSSTVEIDGNTVTDNDLEGIVLAGSTADITNNTVTENLSLGIVVIDDAGTTVRGDIEDNTVSLNEGGGIMLLGAEARIYGNTIEDNGNATTGGAGVMLVTSLGADQGWGESADDSLAGGVIGSSSVGSDENTIQDNLGGGIILFDATIDNISDVEDGNSFGGNSYFEVVQTWPAFIEVQDGDSSPLEGFDVEVWPSTGPEASEDPLSEAVTDAAGYATIDSAWDEDDPDTWMDIPSLFVFDDNGTPVRFEPGTHVALAAYPDEPDMQIRSDYPWDGAYQASKSGSCVQGGGMCRYQEDVIIDAVSCDLSGVSCSMIWLLGGEAINGEPRRAYLCEPTSLAADDPRPLVFGLHGQHESVDHFTQENGGCRMLELAERDGFRVVFPIALRADEDTPASQRWTDCRGGMLAHTSLDERTASGYSRGDVTFVENLVPKVEARVPSTDEVDETRIYAYGHSSGGMLIYRLLTQTAKDEFDGSTSTPGFRGLAAIAANTPQPASGSIQNECTSSSVPNVLGDLLIMDGDDDFYRMPFDGGWVAGSDPGGSSPPAVYDFDYYGAVRAADEQTALGEDGTLTLWKAEMGITGAGDEPLDFADIVAAGSGTPAADEDGSTVSEVVYGDRSDVDSGVIRFYKVANGGHRIPGTGPRQDRLCPENTNDPGGCVNMDISGVDEIWRSFQPRSMYTDFGGSSPYGFTAVADSGSAFNVHADWDLDDNGGAGLKVSLSSYGSAEYRHDYSQSVTQSRVRFWIDPSSATLATIHDAVSIAIGRVPSGVGTDPTWRLELMKDASSDFYLRLGIWDEGDSTDYYANLPLSSGPQLVEIRWRTSSGGGANDGFLCANHITSHNGLAEEDVCVSGIDTDAAEEGRIYFGAPVMDYGVAGSLLLDGFEVYHP